ncbi:phosphatidylglycerol:prolipoprotein diacylglycerol transferase [Thioclava sp. ES.031]|uniref:prolipoprotein diacylglyceryl transferase n=1 Tax=Thioclava sp. ES.031 TaxID=1798203 RepID=UPI000BF7C189|nr:phosphatidylglycerol:prolipoprotein diacylglycerol transferase [Thioclava sp. ES.031]
MLPLAIPFPDFDPVAITIPGLGLPIRWYALAYIAGLIAGWQIIVALMKRDTLWPQNRSPMEHGKVEDLLTAVIIGVVLGGRLGFILFYEPAWYLAHPLDIVKVWQGGMSFHGGFLGTLLAGWWFARRHDVPKLKLADAMALVAPIGLFLGRIANFIKPELWGRPTDVPWGVIFPGELAQTCLGIAGQVDGTCARHPSQLYEAGLEGLLLGLILWSMVWFGRSLKRPGLSLGVFLMGYGAARAFVELFRQGDPQFVTLGNPYGHVIRFTDGWGLTMGQVLSLPMIAVGLYFVIRALRAPKAS